MDLIQESYQRLFPEKPFSYQTELEYNRRLGDFNANIQMRWNLIKINLNLQWKDIDEEIKIGLIQNLLLKVFQKRKKISTPNIELYNNFIKQIPVLTPKTRSDPMLEDSFHRINEKFFETNIEQPNLKWGTDSRRKLACYNFHNDTITVSTLFEDARPEILDYLMYHELLHKYHQFEQKNGRSSYHSPKFKRDEAKYPEFKLIEKEIETIIKTKKRKKMMEKRSFLDFWRF